MSKLIELLPDDSGECFKSDFDQSFAATPEGKSIFGVSCFGSVIYRDDFVAKSRFLSRRFDCVSKKPHQQISTVLLSNEYQTLAHVNHQSELILTNTLSLKRRARLEVRCGPVYSGALLGRYCIVVGADALTMLNLAIKGQKMRVVSRPRKLGLIRTWRIDVDRASVVAMAGTCRQVSGPVKRFRLVVALGNKTVLKSTEIYVKEARGKTRVRGQLN